MEGLSNGFAPGSEGLLTPLNPFFADPRVSEILINKPQEVFVEREGKMTCHRMDALTAAHLKRLFALIANENGLPLTSASPLLSGNLFDGSRVQLVIPPAAKTFALAIRRQSVASMVLDDYRNTSFFAAARADIGHKSPHQKTDKTLLALYHNQRWADFIASAIELKKTIVISGETSSGKTTFLNACLKAVPADERLITLEDTFELNTTHANQLALKAPKVLSSGTPAITMQDLLQAALRLRPDRIIMGELRGREVLDFISACQTGHEGSMTTLHAPNPATAINRLIQLYQMNGVAMTYEEIRTLITGVIDIILQLKPTAGGRQLTAVWYRTALSEAVCP